MSPPTIWAVNDGEKIGRDSLGHPSARGNSVWDGERIDLFGARNEVIAFQVIVEAPHERIAALTASLRELEHESGATITYAPPRADPTDYVERPIEFFAVHYMNVVEPTAAHWICREGVHGLHDRCGWKPVQLVPENAIQNGFPLGVEPGQLQAIWIEIYLAHDLLPGIYRGPLSVSVDGVTTDLPVEVTVFDFSLPDVSSLPTMVYFESEQPELYQGRNLDPEYHRFAHRHRIELVQEYGGPAAGAVLGRFRGDDFTRGFGYEGPGEGVGNKIVPFSFYAPGPDFNERESAWRTSDEWMRFLNESVPDAITFLYLYDEPAPADFPRIRQIATNIRSNPGPGARLPLLVTRFYDPELEDSIDIWDCGAPHYNIHDAESERARGRDHWLCNGGRPEGGAIVIDAPATDVRMLPWACFKHGIEVYFYWHSVHWLHNPQTCGERVQNVWANTVTFDNRGEPGKSREGQGFANGDGVLIYPGEDTLHPEENRGIAGPISTIQLANLRRGLQDHLYLTLARRQGLDAAVSDALQAVVPRVLSDAKDSIGFAEDGDTYESARRKLAVAIAAASG